MTKSELHLRTRSTAYYATRVSLAQIEVSSGVLEHFQSLPQAPPDHMKAMTHSSMQQLLPQLLPEGVKDPKHIDNPDMATSSTSDLWSDDLSEFYANVHTLLSRLKPQESARPVAEYRKEGPSRPESLDFLLTYEEELHLADHFAFLAHVKEGAAYVAAATIEETSDPPQFTLRLACNRTPAPFVVEGLESILRIVRSHAVAGKHAEKYKSMLLHEVVTLNQERIHARLLSKYYKKPKHFKSSDKTSLRSRIDSNLTKVWVQTKTTRKTRAEVDSLRTALINLRNAIEAVDDGPSEDHQRLLETVIQRSHDVSNQGFSTSLETHLPKINLRERMPNSKEVLQIDKLSKYMQICEDLIRLSRQPRTREHCKSFQLSVCPELPGYYPSGSPEKCFVHGEVQLMFHYEQYPAIRRPRAIGSSKAACFLCDLFVRHEGSYGMSHSHNLLFSAWALPNSPWMSTSQQERYREITKRMTAELVDLIGQSMYFHNYDAQSKAHLRTNYEPSVIAPSIVSQDLKDIVHFKGPYALLRQFFNGLGAFLKYP
ncbi:hypothetical protein BGZ60DRAFT_89761 [Tricladium varicosporioides]|nr:hypothetical protein BGZ60DRAFT_89761 [Hymenoscyphus varicosporioides]